MVIYLGTIRKKNHPKNNKSKPLRGCQQKVMEISKPLVRIGQFGVGFLGLALDLFNMFYGESPTKMKKTLLDLLYSKKTTKMDVYHIHRGYMSMSFKGHHKPSVTAGKTHPGANFPIIPKPEFQSFFCGVIPFSITTIFMEIQGYPQNSTTPPSQEIGSY